MNCSGCTLSIPLWDGAARLPLQQLKNISFPAGIEEPRILSVFGRTDTGLLHRIYDRAADGKDFS